jgi:5-formyltetrahydrofolate cyclo-ligase
MVSSIEQLKSDLRTGMRVEIGKLSTMSRIQAASMICVRLAQQEVWKNARSISFFAPMPDEPDVWPLISQTLLSGKVVALPRFSRATQSYIVCRVENLQADIQIGAFGIREPKESCPEVPLNRLDLVLVPGVAFDPHGRRLGRGKGFYDRLLAGFGGRKCGVAFDEQIVGEVPAGPQDIRLNCILTPTRWIET